MSEAHEILEENIEYAEHGHASLSMPVTVTLSILAVLIAIATLLGQRTSKEEILLQAQEADQWSFFQAKNGGLRNAQSNVDMLGVVQPMDKEEAAKTREKYQKEVERYTEEKAEAQKEAQDLRQERQILARRGDRYEAGEVFLEIGLIICTFTLLTKKKGFWFSGMLLGMVGLVLAVSGFLVH